MASADNICLVHENVTAKGKIGVPGTAKVQKVKVQTTATCARTLKRDGTCPVHGTATGRQKAIES